MVEEPTIGRGARREAEPVPRNRLKSGRPRRPSEISAFDFPHSPRLSNCVGSLLPFTAGVTSVVVCGLASIHPSPARAIGIVAALYSASVIVHSLNEPGIAAADSATLSTIATFLLAAEQRRASKAGSKVITVVRKIGKRVGRPPKPLLVPVGQARHLVQLHGYRRAAVLLGVSASSVRRALVKAVVAEQMSNQRSSP